MRPQPGILEAQAAARYYLEYRLAEGVTARQLRAALGALPATGSETDRIVAFGPAALDLLDLDIRLEPFADIRGPKHTAPATQRDLWIAISGEHHDQVLDAVLATHRTLRTVGEIVLDLRGFDYRDSHDLTGFEDGTANPKDEKAEAAAIVAGGVGAGGSFVFTQQWVHDLDAFSELPVAVQEKVVGRTKADSIELEGEVMPADSHVSRTDVEVDGTAMKILRRSSPYGTAREQGLYFVAYTCERHRVQIQLERMFGVSGDGLYDRLTDFSRPVTGSYWFAPSVEQLARLTPTRQEGA